MELVIRADGDRTIGYGHLVRSSSIAEVAISRGYGVTYTTTTPDGVRSVCPEGVSIQPLPARGDPGPLLNWLADTDVRAVFVDAYPVGTAYQRAIRELAPLVVHVDDGRYAVSADVLVNGNLYASDIEYAYVGEEPDWCLGSEYTLLREAVREYCSSSPARRSPPERVIVTMGGSDVLGLTPTVIRSFDGTDLLVDVIVGPGFSNGLEIRDVAESVDADVRVLRNPRDLPERMYRADLGVIACGSTAYELLALGTPFVGIPVADNQERIAAALDDHDAATILGPDATSADIGRELRKLLEDNDLRERRTRIGRNLVDGRGAVRVARKIFSVME